MMKLSEETKATIERKYSRQLAEKRESYRPAAIRAFAAAEALSDAVNEVTFDYDSFALALSSQHRTLQQSAMRAFIAFAKAVAEFDTDGYYDLRNEASVKLAVAIKELEVALPYV